MKKYKNIILAMGLCLLPIVYGSLVYNKLPEMLPTHFDFSGNIDGYTSKFTEIYIMPLITSAIILFVYIVTRLDPKKLKTNNKLLNASIFIFPLIFNILAIVSISVGLGYKLNVNRIMPIIIAIMFIILGNYMPKASKNYMVGIRLPWTLDDEVNWNKTHKFGGICYIILGIIILISSLFDIGMYVVIGGIILINLLIMGYSYYIYYKKK